MAACRRPYAARQVRALLFGADPSYAYPSCDAHAAVVPSERRLGGFPAIESVQPWTSLYVSRGRFLALHFLNARRSSGNRYLAFGSAGTFCSIRAMALTRMAAPVRHGNSATSVVEESKR